MAGSLPGGPFAGFNGDGNPNGNIYLRLVYPIAVALMTFVVGALFIRETFRRRIWDEVGGEDASQVGRPRGPA